MEDKIEVLETEDVKTESTALQKYMQGETPEQRKERTLKAIETKKKNKKEQHEIEVATRALMMQKYKVKSEGKSLYLSGYELRANALFDEVVNHGKNMIGAEKLLRETLGEEKVDEVTNNNIQVVFVQGQEINI